MSTTIRLGVIGNPITHSLSPVIHQQFAQQFADDIDYQKYLVEENNLSNFVKQFFDGGGRGLNVTLPYKQAVIQCIDSLTEEAEFAGSVNTILKNQQGQLVGHTTDGQGLLLDLDGHGFDIQQKKILVIGAGGASQSILVALLKAGAIIRLHNRNKDKITKLIEQFSVVGDIDSFQRDEQYDGVISAVTEFNSGLMKPVANCIGNKTFCYDLNYAARAQDFYQFALRSGCTAFADGLGMLVGQAAYSYQMWTGHLPNINQVKIPS
ncbi:shikimate dehydrogenase [Aliikangiella sp. IMCC44359]|uniref:shikimate dehydrogenase n=1 Tax=Aliikangiella sp. IMCC44359 TaxID=3459125 RepID=UPI00403ACBDC